MKQDFRTLFLMLIIGIFLVSCSGQEQSTPVVSLQPKKTSVTTEPATEIPPSEVPTITHELTITQESTSQNDTGTVLNFKFPFEPAFPGYLVEIRSKPLSVDLMCILEQDKTTGDAIELNPNSSATNKYGM